MKSEQLVDLVSQRKVVLEMLVEISQRQLDAVHHGRMNELMGLLAEKQTPLARLRDLSQTLAIATPDDPEARVWGSPNDRAECQREHEQCEQMLRSLMEIEARCEQTLASSKEKLRQELQQTQTAQQAVSGYSEAELPSSSGGRLDLSSQ